MTTPKIRQLQRVTTGVPGFDFIVDGGLIETGVYIVQGAAGAGKTIFANQICFHQAEQKRSAVYYTLLTESHDRMLAFLQQMTFFDANAVSQGVNYVSGFKLLEAEGLPGVIRSIRDVLSAQRPALLAVDGLVTAEEIAPNDTAFKKFLHDIQTVATMFRCTVLLLTNTEGATRLQAEHTMVDGIITLDATDGLQSQRTIEVSKFRGAGQLRGTHSFEISTQGITIRPRVETRLKPSGLVPRKLTGKRLSTGVPSLDPVVGGGLLEGSNTMLLGASGTGKTLLGMHFINAAAAAGERGLYFTFYEQPSELVEKARRLGMQPFVDAVERGDITIIWVSSVEANVDRIGNSLISEFDALKPSRVFIDGMHGFQVTQDPPERIQDFFAAVSDHFIAHGATMMFTAETIDLIGDAAIKPPFPNASRLCQNILVFRFAEVRGTLRRVATVFKMRDSDFDSAVRVVTITGTGVHVGESIATADMLLSGQPMHATEADGE